jgi:translocation and assembly module TamB
MTQSPNNNNSSEIQLQEKPPKSKRWRRFFLWLGISLLIVTGSSVAIAWYFIQRQLSPLVEKNLSNTLNRPINLGEVKGFSVGFINFDSTEILATETDPDWVKLDQVRVSFNLWDFINPFQDREKPTLNINLTLINPRIYIEQGKNLSWVDTRINQTESGNFEINLNKIELKNTNLTVVPRIDDKLVTPIETYLPTGIAHFRQNNQHIQFNLAGYLQDKKWYQIQGEVFTQRNETNLKVSGKELDVKILDTLLPIPLQFIEGTVNPSLEISFKQDQPSRFFGVVNLNNVTAKIGNLPQSFSKTNGNLVFKDREIQLLGIKTEFGKAKGAVSGIVDLEKGLALQAQLESILIKDLLTTLNIPKPTIPIEGELQGNVKVTGKLEQPLLTAEVISKQTLLIDKIRFKSLRGNIAFFKSTLLVQGFEALPIFGGKVIGQGQLVLPQQDLLFDIGLTNIQANQIARIYNRNLPVRSAIVNQGRFQLIGNGKKLLETLAVGDANVIIGNNMFTANNLKIELNQKGKWQGLLNTANLDLDDLIKQFQQENNLPDFLKQGQITGKLNVGGTLESFEANRLQAQGNVILNSQKGSFQLQNLQLAQGKWNSNLQIENLQLEDNSQGNYPNNINGIFSLIGSLNSFSLAGLSTWGRGQLNFRGENFAIESLNFENNIFNLKAGVSSLPLRKIFPNLTIPLNSFLTGKFTIKGNINALNLNQLKGEGIGQINLAGGNINATRFTFEKGYWETIATLNNIKTRQLNSTLPINFSPIINGTVNLKGKLEDFTLETLKGSGSGLLILSGGMVSIPDFTVDKGKFNTTMIPQNFSLRHFSPQQPGTITGNILASGSLTKPSLNGIQAEGNLNFNNIIQNQESPLNALFNWDGKRLNLPKVATEGLMIRGFLDLNANFLGERKGIENISLNVIAQEFNLNNIKIPAPFPLLLEGLMNFKGNITGTGINPQIMGDINLADFALDSLKFDPILQGAINMNEAQGISLYLTSANDNITLQLDSNFRPITAEIKKDQIFASLIDQKEYVDIKIARFPLKLLRNLITICQDHNCFINDFPPVVDRLIPPTLLAQNLDGLVSSNFNFSYNSKNLVGNIHIDDPVIGRIRGDRFSLDLNYDDGIFTLNNGEFRKNESLYQFNTSFISAPSDSQFTFNSNIKQGDIQDILIALQLFEIGDIAKTLNTPQYGTAKDLYLPLNSPNICNPNCLPLFSPGIPKASILDQLRRFAEIQALLQQQRQLEKNTFNLPKLSELTGQFDGTITAESRGNSGIKAKFQLTGGQTKNNQGETIGNPWYWGNFVADQIHIDGQYENGIIQLVPVKIQTGNALINFNGTFGGATQSGEITISQLPLSSLRNLINLPPQIGFGGILNGKANFSGSRENPSAIGQIQVTDATINQTPVYSTNGAFNYSNAKLIFWVNSILTQGNEPLTIRGSIPYQLPFGTTSPSSNEIQLAFYLQNESLALLNILTKNQIEWIDGQGEVNLNISGILEQQKPSNLIANGIINIENATIAADALPEGNLTGVTGTINFDFDTLEVQQLVGNFGGGQITAAGNLPINTPIFQENPLMISLDPLTVDLKRIYQGDVKGEIIITGTALSPTLTGILELFDGRILLSDKTETTPQDNQDGEFITSTQLDNLQLSLGERIQITRPPILNFLAEGSLLVNGTLDAPQPEGIIRLKRGQVNLFTSQLGLAGGQDHIAQFFPDRGLDPYLDIRLATSVAETTSRPLPDNPLSAEVSDIPATNFGQLQTIRIEAEVRGFASQLTDSLILKSNPSRSKTEIVALLGGGFINTLGQDDPSLGLVNLAGSAILGTVQDTIGQALGLTEFRLFPTSVLDENGRTSSLGLAAEASVDVTRELSVSALKILTTEQPAQFGLRYRLNDNLILRGSTDFSGDSRGALEYEIRF